MGMYSSGSIFYQTRMGGIEWIKENDRILFDVDGTPPVPDLKERWEANGMEWSDDMLMPVRG